MCDVSDIIVETFSLLFFKQYYFIEVCRNPSTRSSLKIPPQHFSWLWLGLSGARIWDTLAVREHLVSPRLYPPTAINLLTLNRKMNPFCSFPATYFNSWTLLEQLWFIVHNNSYFINTLVKKFFLASLWFAARHKQKVWTVGGWSFSIQVCVPYWTILTTILGVWLTSEPRAETELSVLTCSYVHWCHYLRLSTIYDFNNMYGWK